VGELGFVNLFVVTAIAFGAPLALGLAPSLRVPAVVVEIARGIAVGPNGLGWVEIDVPLEVMSLLGLAFLLFPSAALGLLRGASPRTEITP